MDIQAEHVWFGNSCENMVSVVQRHKHAVESASIYSQDNNEQEAKWSLGLSDKQFA